ncbi:MAG: rhodanese-like domain-containing protein [Pseudomonadota bacterium]|jgi:rhodanese-related sulfurtransferase|nr:rhodanese-like domain-containing protein [Pseudomonadota bacterium]PQM66313.1 MAG: sulfurtransferase [Rhodobacterales bacterium]|tara:strand:- start:636 stop:1034 length:399 start_codon:yes stop_codon:yes gene_type:complete
MKKLKKTVKNMVAEAKSKINEIDAKDAIKFFNDENVIFIDIRDIRERQKLGFIPGSFHAPRGMLEFWIDPESPYFKDIFNTNKKYIFHCAAGWRSALAVSTLNDMGFEASHITDGFAGWVEEKGPVEFKSKK